jgi:biopolymer transport protein ExbB
MAPEPVKLPPYRQVDRDPHKIETLLGNGVNTALGGPAGWLLILLSIAVLTVAFERICFWSLWWKKRTARRHLWLDLLREGGHRPEIWIDERDLEMRFAHLFLEAAMVIAPLLGLIGTVLSLSRFLATLGPDLVLPAGAKLSTLSDALLCTAFGLIVSLMATVTLHVNNGLRQRQLAIWQLDLQRSSLQ